MLIQYIIARRTLWHLMLLSWVIAWLVALVIVSISDSSGKYSNKVSRSASGKLMYVLAGTQHSLTLKYCTAADLYKKGGIDKIVVATNPGLTIYDKNIGRNLTNDEWSVKQFTRLGVQFKDISFIKLKNCFFGTLGEARTLRELCVEKGIDRLLLVCSEYHSKRVLYAFSNVLKDTGVKIEIHTVDEQVGLRDHFFEIFKSLFYRYALIPLESWLRDLS